MKFMGSKTKYTKEILPIILKDRQPEQWYVEPFAGGMNMICEVEGNRIANDIHTPLIAMWRELTSGWMPEMMTKEEYLEIKANKSKYSDYFLGWAGLICTFRGLWFSTFAGEITNKIGRVRNYQAEAIRNVKNQIPKMKGVIFQNKHYHELEIPPNSIVYCDPPYEGTQQYFNKDFDHKLFWDWVRKISKQGHQVFVSEYNAPDDFECIWQKETTCRIAILGKGEVIKKMERVERLFKFKD